MDSLSSQDPMIMGIVNVTPDSFSDGGRCVGHQQAMAHIEQLVNEGATIIDIGAESSRPGAEPISATEECARLGTLIADAKRAFSCTLSIDTTKAQVAAYALEQGAVMINDISALTADPAMAEVCKRYQPAVCVMHRQGVSASMQHNPRYNDVVHDVAAYLCERVRFCKSLGVSQVMIDPGIGFGKTLAHNLALLQNLHVFTRQETPVLLGTSRKSLIHALTGAAVTDRLGGSIASVLAAWEQGVRAFRVHDVAQTVQALTVFDAVRNAT